LLVGEWIAVLAQGDELDIVYSVHLFACCMSVDGPPFLCCCCCCSLDFIRQS
jgi:hypothetical protein